MQTLIKKIVNEPSFNSLIAVFVKQCVIREVEEELIQEPPVTKKIPSPPNCSLSACADTSLSEESSTRRLRCRLYDQKD